MKYLQALAEKKELKLKKGIWESSPKQHSKKRQKKCNGV